MRKAKYSLSLHYGLGGLIAVSALLLSLLLRPVMEKTPFMLVSTAVVITAWYGGLGPCLLATCLGTILVSYVFSPPLHSVVTFVLVSVLVGLISAKRRQAEVAIHKSEKRFRALIENSSAGFMLVDSEGIILHVGPPILGYGSQEWIGRNAFEAIHPEDRQHMMSLLAELAREPGKKLTAEYRARHKDGGWRWMASVGTNLLAEPSVQAIVINYRDITGRKRAEEERSQLLAQAEGARKEAEQAQKLSAELLVRVDAALAEAREANQAKDEFLAMVSHELHKPLNSIILGAHLLYANRLDEAGAVRALELIERSTKSQTRLIDDLLDCSRTITDKLRLDVEPVKLIPVIEAALDSVRPAADAKAIQLQVALDNSVGIISGDPNRVQQIVWNLVSNAIKFTPAGGRVEVRARAIDSQAQITVSDTGVGITPEFLPHVFERFSQAASAAGRKHGGLGLGLAIVRHLVEMHGGTVRAESEGGSRGATFTVNLPLACHPQAQDNCKDWHEDNDPRADLRRETLLR